MLQRFGGYALVEANPKTGLPHLVRAHLAARGHPAIADPLYGKRDHPAHHLLGRLSLRAFKLRFEHPASQEITRFEDPYPEDFSSRLIEV